MMATSVFLTLAILIQGFQNGALGKPLASYQITTADGVQITKDPMTNQAIVSFTTPGSVGSFASSTYMPNLDFSQFATTPRPPFSQFSNPAFLFNNNNQMGMGMGMHHGMGQFFDQRPPKPQNFVSSIMTGPGVINIPSSTPHPQNLPFMEHDAGGNVMPMDVSPVPPPHQPEVLLPESPIDLQAPDAPIVPVPNGPLPEPGEPIGEPIVNDGPPPQLVVPHGGPEHGRDSLERENEPKEDFDKEQNLDNAEPVKLDSELTHDGKVDELEGPVLTPEVMSPGVDLIETAAAPLIHHITPEPHLGLEEPELQDLHEEEAGRPDVNFHHGLPTIQIVKTRPTVVEEEHVIPIVEERPVVTGHVTTTVAKPVIEETVEEVPVLPVQPVVPVIPVQPVFPVEPVPMGVPEVIEPVPVPYPQQEFARPPSPPIVLPPPVNPPPVFESPRPELITPPQSVEYNVHSYPVAPMAQPVPVSVRPPPAEFVPSVIAPASVEYVQPELVAPPTPPVPAAVVPIPVQPAPVVPFVGSQLPMEQNFSADFVPGSFVHPASFEVPVQGEIPPPLPAVAPQLAAPMGPPAVPMQPLPLYPVPEVPLPTQLTQPGYTPAEVVPAVLAQPVLPVTVAPALQPIVPEASMPFQQEYTPAELCPVAPMVAQPIPGAVPPSPPVDILPPLEQVHEQVQFVQPVVPAVPVQLSGPIYHQPVPVSVSPPPQPELPPPVELPPPEEVHFVQPVAPAPVHYTSAETYSALPMVAQPVPVVMAPPPPELPQPVEFPPPEQVHFVQPVAPAPVHYSSAEAYQTSPMVAQPVPVAVAPPPELPPPEQIHFVQPVVPAPVHYTSAEEYQSSPMVAQPVPVAVAPPPEQVHFVQPVAPAPVHYTSAEAYQTSPMVAQPVPVAVAPPPEFSQPLEIPPPQLPVEQVQYVQPVMPVVPVTPSYPPPQAPPTPQPEYLEQAPIVIPARPLVPANYVEPAYVPQPPPPVVPLPIPVPPPKIVEAQEPVVAAFVPVPPPVQTPMEQQPLPMLVGPPGPVRPLPPVQQEVLPPPVPAPHEVPSRPALLAPRPPQHLMLPPPEQPVVPETVQPVMVPINFSVPPPPPVVTAQEVQFPQPVAYQEFPVAPAMAEIPVRIPLPIPAASPEHLTQAMPLPVITPPDISHLNLRPPMPQIPASEIMQHVPQVPHVPAGLPENVPLPIVPVESSVIPPAPVHVAPVLPPENIVGHAPIPVPASAFTNNMPTPVIKDVPHELAPAPLPLTPPQAVPIPVSTVNFQQFAPLPATPVQSVPIEAPVPMAPLVTNQVHNFAPVLTGPQAAPMLGPNNLSNFPVPLQPVAPNMANQFSPTPVFKPQEEFFAQPVAPIPQAPIAIPIPANRPPLVQQTQEVVPAVGPPLPPAELQAPNLQQATPVLPVMPVMPVRPMQAQQVPFTADQESFMAQPVAPLANFTPFQQQAVPVLPMTNRPIEVPAVGIPVQQVASPVLMTASQDVDVGPPLLPAIPAVPVQPVLPPTITVQNSALPTNILTPANIQLPMNQASQINGFFGGRPQLPQGLATLQTPHDYLQKAFLDGTPIRMSKNAGDDDTEDSRPQRPWIRPFTLPNHPKVRAALDKLAKEVY